MKAGLCLLKRVLRVGKEGKNKKWQLENWRSITLEISHEQSGVTDVEPLTYVMYFQGLDMIQSTAHLRKIKIKIKIPGNFESVHMHTTCL